MSTNVRPIDIKVDVGNQFINEQKFVVHDRMFQGICTGVAKLGFCVVIGRSDNYSNRRLAFVTQRCERSGKYIVVPFWISYIMQNNIV